MAKKLCDSRSDRNPTGPNVNLANNVCTVPFIIHICMWVYTYGPCVCVCMNVCVCVCVYECVLVMQEGLTPILAAVLRNVRELVVLLISHRANVNQYMLCGGERTLEVSPLSCAAASGTVEMVRLLVQSEANINATAVS